MCFGGVAAAIDAILRSLKEKILSRINKSWVLNFPRCESKWSNQNTKVVQFYPWKVAIPNFSGTNDRIEINNFSCLVSCSKRLYKWKSLGAGSNSSNINVSIIKAQWQWHINQYLCTYASWQHWYSLRKYKLIHPVAVSIRLRSIYLYICPVVILIQSHLKQIYTLSGCLNMVIIEINMLRPVAISIQTLKS